MIRKAKPLALLFLLHAAASYAQTATALKFAWDPSPSPSVSGYFVYTVDSGNAQTVKIDVGNTTYIAINSLQSGHKYSIYVTAYDSAKNESKPSNVLVTLHHGEKRGRIEIVYYGNVDLQRVLTALGLSMGDT